ncbi:MAG: Rieske (2Fe-2S) protein [Alphaproteobacteria bacterium]|nr:Rieske (2Fe-2S) protein [Alphaproteobacteria bacterium]
MAAADGSHGVVWPGEGLARVPYDLYTDPSIYAGEQARIFRGPVWNFLCLAAEIPVPGDYKTTFIGDTPVIVVRDLDGAINALENRCAHRGALVCYKARGNARMLTCAYHSWVYDLKGGLRSVAFERGINGQGGMPDSFAKSAHGLKRLRVAEYAGLVFASFSDAAPAIDAYLGPEIAARVERVLPRPIKVTGYNRQLLANNWKLYVENNKDSYHASLLHTFFTTFRLNRLSQKGGIIVDASGGHHVSYSIMASEQTDRAYEDAAIRSAKQDYRLADASLVAGRDEFGDGISLQILSIFPAFVMQQVQNSLAVRQILPKGTGQTELIWTYYGFADDDAAMDMIRLKQSNLVGPAGYVSLEDGAIGGFVQRAIAGATGQASVLEMGGRGVESQATRATETSVRGFWRAYRQAMGI